MPSNEDYVERTTEDPTIIRQEELRVVRHSSNAGWWVAALIAIVAVVGVFFYMSQNTQSDLQAARDQGAAQAQADNAATNAQTAASQAAQSAQSAVDSTAQAAQHAANAATARAATAADNAHDASTSEPAPTPPPQ
jgi:hypothetical protein